MRAKLPVLLPFLLLTTAVTAAPLNVTEQDGSPAIEGDGSSSTTVSIVGGAVEVAVEASGTGGVYTHSGTAKGEGSVGVPQLGLEFGGGGGNGSDDNPGPGDDTDSDNDPGGSDDGTGGSGGGTGGTSGGTGGTGGGPDGDDAGPDAKSPSTGGTAGPGGDNPGKGPTVSRVAATAEACLEVAPGGDATARSVSNISGATTISVIDLCDGRGGLSAGLTAAIEKNVVLVAALSSAGFAPAAVVGVDIEASGSAVLYVDSE